MKYTFDGIKDLYDRFDVILNEKTQCGEIIDKKYNRVFSFEAEGAEQIRFSHYWVRAANYGQTLVPCDHNFLTPEEYERAFNDISREAYNAMMAIEIQSVQSSKRTCWLQVIEEKLKDTSSIDVLNIIRALFYIMIGHNYTFDEWCYFAAKELTVDELIGKEKKLN